MEIGTSSESKNTDIANSELLNSQQSRVTQEADPKLIDIGNSNSADDSKLIDIGNNSNSADYFLESLQLQHKVECGRTFMESIGLYWLNPADNKENNVEKQQIEVETPQDPPELQIG